MTVFPAADAAEAMIDSGRPVPTTIRSKLDGSMGGYDVVLSITEVVRC